MNTIARLLLGTFRSDLESLRPVLYRIAYSWCHEATLADDLVQDTLSRAWSRRAQLRGAAALKAWAVSIMHHCWVDHLRARKEFDDVDDWQDTLASPADTPEVRCGREQVIACVRAAVARLPVGQRQVITLVDLEEFSYAEVAQILGIPVGTVMSRLSRARTGLKTLLERAQRAEAARPDLRRVK